MLLETHIHSYLGSPCGKLSPEVFGRLYKEKGYGGLVITEHYNKNFFNDYYLKGSWENKLNCFLSGYRLARSQCTLIDLKVFLGAEIHLNQKHTGKAEEYLLYGCNEDFFIKYPRLYDLKQEELYKLCKENGIVMVQAHPFRSYCSLGNPDFMDGIEIYNGNPRHKSNNYLALRAAKKYGKLMLSGSDFHEKTDLGRGGIVVPDDILTDSQLADYLINNQPMLIKKGKIKK